MKIGKQLKELELFLDNVEEFLDMQADRAESEDERQKMEDYFPNLLRSSLFVTIYSTVENELNQLCRMYAKDDGLDVDDLRGNGIQRACTFLTKVCRIDFPQHSQEWKLLKEYNQLRNAIVHNNGQDRGHHLELLVNEGSGLTLGKNNQVHLEREFCPHVLEVVREFFNNLNSALDKKNRH